MSFLHRIAEYGAKMGRNVMNAAKAVIPYATAGIRTIANSSFISNIKALGGEGFNFVKNVATGNPFGAVKSGVALYNIGRRTVGDAVQTYKKELANAKNSNSGGAKVAKRPVALRMTLPRKEPKDGVKNKLVNPNPYD